MVTPFFKIILLPFFALEFFVGFDLSSDTVFAVLKCSYEMVVKIQANCQILGIIVFLSRRVIIFWDCVKKFERLF